MERLKKKQLRALLKFIRECYSICDLETLWAARCFEALENTSYRNYIAQWGSTRARLEMYVRAPTCIAFTPVLKKKV